MKTLSKTIVWSTIKCWGIWRPHFSLWNINFSPSSLQPPWLLNLHDHPREEFKREISTLTLLGIKKCRQVGYRALEKRDTRKKIAPFSSNIQTFLTLLWSRETKRKFKIWTWDRGGAKALFSVRSDKNLSGNWKTDYSTILIFPLSNPSSDTLLHSKWQKWLHEVTECQRTAE